MTTYAQLSPDQRAALDARMPLDELARLHAIRDAASTAARAARGPYVTELDAYYRGCPLAAASMHAHDAYCAAANARWEVYLETAAAPAAAADPILGPDYRPEYDLAFSSLTGCVYRRFV